MSSDRTAGVARACGCPTWTTLKSKIVRITRLRRVREEYKDMNKVKFILWGLHCQGRLYRCLEYSRKISHRLSPRQARTARGPRVARVQDQDRSEEACKHNQKWDEKIPRPKDKEASTTLKNKAVGDPCLRHQDAKQTHGRVPDRKQKDHDDSKPAQVLIRVNFSLHIWHILNKMQKCVYIFFIEWSSKIFNWQA